MSKRSTIFWLMTPYNHVEVQFLPDYSVRSKVIVLFIVTILRTSNLMHLRSKMRELVKWFDWHCTNNKCERKVQMTWKVTQYQNLFWVRRLIAYLTTTKFHILAASATVVQTVLQPAKSISFWGLLYSKLYITEAPSPGSHYKGKVFKTQNYKIMKLL